MFSVLLVNTDWDASALAHHLIGLADIADLFVCGRAPSALPVGSHGKSASYLGPWRSAGFNDALRRMSTEHLLLINEPIELRQSTLSLLEQALCRNPEYSFIYTDYELVGADSNALVIQLAEPGPGRIKEIQDYGSLRLFRRKMLEAIGGMDESLMFAALYDLQLRLSEVQYPVLIRAARGGAPYRLLRSRGPVDVFYYLRDSKDAQLEYERVFTQHLVRTGAYLAPARALPPPPLPISDRNIDCVASVIIPVYHRPGFIARALESSFAQTRKNFEVIVVCGGGAADPTVDVVRPFVGGYVPGERPAVKLEVVDINNLGFMINAGLAKAESPYYIQLDSDDKLKPNAVEAAVAYLDAHASIAAATAYAEVHFEGGDRATPSSHSFIVEHEEWTGLNGPNNLLRVGGLGNPRIAHVAAIVACGGFPVNDLPFSRNAGEDYDILLRLTECFQVGRIHEPLYEIYRHSENTTDFDKLERYSQVENAKDASRAEAVARRTLLNGCHPSGVRSLRPIAGRA